MPFTRSDDHHVDSCWTTWNNPATKLKITTYPMIHIGESLYYERVSSDIARCQYALLEGVSWRLGDGKRPLYDLVARNLGIAAPGRGAQNPGLGHQNKHRHDALRISRASFQPASPIHPCRCPPQAPALAFDVASAAERRSHPTSTPAEVAGKRHSVASSAGWSSGSTDHREHRGILPRA